jgi:cation transport ATPase
MRTLLRVGSKATRKSRAVESTAPTTHRTTLEAGPKDRASPRTAATAPSTARPEYVCPMHAQIVREAPGSCPICGMALEPRAVATQEGPNAELVDMRRRLFVSIGPAAIVFLIGMSDLLPGMPLNRAIGAGAVAWIEFILATPLVLWGAWPFFVRGWRSILSRHLNMFTLFSLGIGVPYAYSVVALPSTSRQPRLSWRWSCSDRSLSSEREARRTPRSGRYCILPPRRRDAFAPMVSRRTCSWTP